MSKPRRPKRAVDGIVLLDKPTGLSSNDALMQVRRLFMAETAGHTGTLDPMATGLLPICLGRSTVLCGQLLDATKTYEAEVQFGVATDTGDAEGEATRHSNPSALTAEQLAAAMAAFRGDIQQIPPMYSALKQGGVRLHELARAGLEVERPPRAVHIYAFELLDWQAPRAVVRVRCSKGTYVRTLAEDWAQRLGQAAHLTALRRSQVGVFSLAAAYALSYLQAVSDASGLPGLDALRASSSGAIGDWRVLRPELDQLPLLQRGMAVPVDAAVGPCAMLHPVHGKLLGFAEVTPMGRLQPRRWLGQDGIE